MKSSIIVASITLRPLFVFLACSVSDNGKCAQKILYLFVVGVTLRFLHFALIFSFSLSQFLLIFFLVVPELSKLFILFFKCSHFFQKLFSH